MVSVFATSGIFFRLARRCGHGQILDMNELMIDGPSEVHWQFVKNLLHDLQAEEDREQLASLFGQWRLSIRVFRRVETARMVNSEPTEVDLIFHRACVTELISVGSWIELAAMGHTEEDLRKHGLKLGVIRAMDLDLRNSFDEWHGQSGEKHIEQLQERIFHAAPELNLGDSRA